MCCLSASKYSYSIRLDEFYPADKLFDLFVNAEILTEEHVNVDSFLRVYTICIDRNKIDASIRKSALEQMTRMFLEIVSILTLALLRLIFDRSPHITSLVDNVWLVQVKSQICHGIAQYDRCSTNGDCACLYIAGTLNIGICSDRFLADCSELVKCDQNNLCGESEHRCVHHPRCHSHPVCYLVPSYNRQLCPLITMMNITTTTVAPTTTATRTQQLVNIPANAKWKQSGVTVAGGNEDGGATNQLYWPCGLFVDDDQTVVIADSGNHRIMQWKNDDTTNGQVVAGGNAQGNRLHQLNNPSDVLIDKETDSLIICDYGNQRVVRWSLRSGTTQGLNKISNETLTKPDELDNKEMKKEQVFIDLPFIGIETKMLGKKIIDLAKYIRPDLHIQPIPRPPPAITTFFPQKDKINKNAQSNIVYSISCSDCDEHGAPQQPKAPSTPQIATPDLNIQSLRRSDRLRSKPNVNYCQDDNECIAKSQEKNDEKLMKSALYKHQMNMNHTINWNDWKIISKDCKKYRLLVRESLQILHKKTILNRTMCSVPLVVYPEGLQISKPTVKIKLGTIIKPRTPGK
ncbi:unnamed protein product [Rotaria socialis]|uniref:Uncharacterized protein n=1 Tax=Rotaria socialis TaxID=392032 RepID=A0A818D3I2_9BILA|nr:unnamed protein product [Rotaria socialis]